MINEVGINDKCGGYLRLIPLVLLLVPPTLPLVPPGVLRFSRVPGFPPFGFPAFRLFSREASLVVLVWSFGMFVVIAMTRVIDVMNLLSMKIKVIVTYVVVDTRKTCTRAHGLNIFYRKKTCKV